MKLFDYLSVLGLSSVEIAFARKISQMMLDYHLNLAEEQSEKMAKAKAQIAETGKTKLDWDETVLTKDYIWSIDVIHIDLKVPRPSVVFAMRWLEANRYVKCFLLNGHRSQCYYIPLDDVLKHV